MPQFSFFKFYICHKSLKRPTSAFLDVVTKWLYTWGANKVGYLRTTGFTFHKDNNNIKKFLKGQVTVSIFISQREHGGHKQGVSFEAKCVSKLWRRQLALENLSGSLAGKATHISGVTLLYFQNLHSEVTVRDSVIICHHSIISPTSAEDIIKDEFTVTSNQQLVLLAWGWLQLNLKQDV